MYPIVRGNLDEYKYYVTNVSNIRCTEAEFTSNIFEALGNDVKTCGFLITKDDGKESYFQCKPDTYSAIVSDLIPNRTYKVRWYAQNFQGREYYGVSTEFSTHPINPHTLKASQITTSSCKLEANIFYDKYTKCGFYVYQGDEDNGFYVWEVESEGDIFSAVINGLQGNTRYNFLSVCQVDNVNYEGNTIFFDTAAICTLSPSNFTDNSAQINGEVDVDVEEVYFEYRSSSTPSVIESSVVKGERENKSVRATLTDLIFDEIYKYRIVAISEGSKLYGDWIEFNFHGEAGIHDCLFDATSEPIIYNLNGIRINSHIESLPRGIYIICDSGKYRKILIQ